jgi:hypothetical protein
LRSFAFRRSQDEVAVHAEGEGPVAGRAEDAEPVEPGVHLGVPDVHAHVELRGDVPLGAGADPAQLPVRIAVGHVGDRARLLGGEVGDRDGVEDRGKEVAGTGLVAAAWSELRSSLFDPARMPPILHGSFNVSAPPLLCGPEWQEPLPLPTHHLATDQNGWS